MPTLGDHHGPSLSDALVGVAAELAGGHDAVSAGHRTYWRWRLALLPASREVRIGETAARFPVTTRSERRRIRGLGGERFVVRAFLEDLDGTETVWDVGACIGTYACFAAQRLPRGRVVAFEPEPTNRSRLRENLRANAPADRWEVSSVAVSDRDGSATLASEFVEPGGGHHYLAGHDGGRDVATRRGERLGSGPYPPPDVVKLDVQGCELRVLRGMGAALETVETIYAEVHTEKTKRYDATAEEVEAFLREAGYAVERLGEPSNGRPGVYFVRARR